MVKKLLVVSDDPADIWYHFDMQQPGFFYKVVMNEYGVDQDFSRKVLEDFREEIKQLQVDFENQLSVDSEGY